MVRVTKLELHRTISEIMKKGDLDHLTTKKIRILCEQKYNIDLSSRKEEIDRIVMAFVNKHCEDSKKGNKTNSEEESESEESDDNSSGSSESSEYDSCSESEPEVKTPKAPEVKTPKAPEVKTPKAPEPKQPVMNKVVKSPPKPAPVPKKATVKRSNSDDKKTTDQPDVKNSANAQAQKKPKKDNMQKKAEIDDAEFARKLQASEFSFRKRTAVNLFRDIPSKKTASNEPAKKKKSTAFQRKCLLSPALAEVLGTNEMSRPDIVQKMWSVVRERNLFDQSNKQYALLDDQLREVFGTKRVRLMGMMKYLKKHIKDAH